MYVSSRLGRARSGVEPVHRKPRQRRAHGAARTQRDDLSGPVAPSVRVRYTECPFMGIAPGDQLGTYRIVARLGGGGMGEVYRAADARLGREIALKILPPHLATNPERLRRFQQEARATAAMNHPNIVTLYTVEQANGVHFLTMELVNGRPLHDLIPRNGMDTDRVLDLGTTVADALAAAHDKDLVHRDLKPANIMITSDGRVKLLDFGLAKVVRAIDPDGETRTDVSPTRHGVVMGTPAYMSPEQISGSGVDHRTDIFALGTILYEMLTGQRPFQGHTQLQLAASILRDPMPRISKAGVPGALVDLIAHCMAKAVDERPSSAREVAQCLQSIRAGATSVATAVATAAPVADGFRVAVAPFKATGATGALSALAEGLTEEIIAGLCRFSYLRVLEKGTAGARYVLEGSLRQVGEQVRVAVQLKEAANGATLWAESYTRAYSSDRIFEIQDDLVPTIVSTIGETNGILTHSMWTGLRDRPPATLTPYEAMLRCFGALEVQSPAELRLAAAALVRAIQQEPNHSGCLAMLSVAHAYSYGVGFSISPEPLDAGLAYAHRAVTAEPSSHLAHHALAIVHFFRQDIPAFQSAAERALALNPMDSYTLASLGMRTAFLGDWTRGTEMVQRAMRLNPRHPGWYWFASTVNAFRQHDFSLALRCALKINTPQLLHCAAALTAIHGHLDNAKEAGRALKDLLAIEPAFASDCRNRLARYFRDPELLDLWVAGLRRAGLFDGQTDFFIASGLTPDKAADAPVRAPGARS
jgi:non-specific serine/threonine protein kinase